MEPIQVKLKVVSFNAMLLDQPCLILAMLTFSPGYYHGLYCIIPLMTSIYPKPWHLTAVHSCFKSL